MKNLNIAKIKRLSSYYFKPFIIIVNSIIGLVRGIMYVVGIIKDDTYCIKSTYIPRKENRQFNDTINKDEYQDKVYLNIKNFCLEKNLSKILDFGCGSGYKLLKYFNDFETVGLEIDPAYSYLKNKYPHKRWGYGDFKTEFKEKFDIAIAVDVIEHLINPDELINFFVKLNCSYFAFSTPDRNGLKILSRIGPPENKYHIREWTSKEFKNYLARKFRILYHLQDSPFDNLFIVTKLS